MTTPDSQRVVPGEAIFDCPACHGAGYEVEQVCCGKLGEQCCGDPDVQQVPCASCVTVARDVLARLRSDSETLQRLIVLHPEARESMQADADAAKAALRSPPVATVVGDEVLLPCDVAVAPATCFRAGVPLAMVLRSIESRRDDDAPHHFPPKGRFAQLAAAQEGVKPIPACWRYVHADPSNSSGWMDYDGDAELWELRGKKAQANGLTIELAYSRPPAQTQGVDAVVAKVDEGEDGLFIEIVYGDDGSPLKCGDSLYLHPAPPATPEDRRDGERSGGEHEWGHAALDAAQADHEGV